VLALAMGMGGGCSQPEPPLALGIAAGSTFHVPALMGIEDGLAVHPGLSVEVVVRDEPSAGSAGALAVSGELAALPGMVAVIGHSNSASSLAASPVYSDHGVVQVAPTSSSPLYARAAPLSYSLVPSDEAQGEAVARLVAGTLGRQGRVAVLFVNDDYGRELRASLLPALARLGHDVVLDLPHVEIEVEAPDVEGILALLRTAEPEAVAFLGRSQVLDRLLPPLREALGAVPVVGPDGIGISRGFTGWTPGAAWDGVVFLDFVDTRGTPPLEAFRTRLLARAPGREPTSTSILSYDAGRLLVEGIAAGARSGAEMAAWLDALEGDEPWMEALLGGPVSFDSVGSVARAYRVRRMPDAWAPPGSTR
jgi:branched-chain amino acid transport system substrate-binding protein